MSCYCLKTQLGFSWGRSAVQKRNLTTQLVLFLRRFFLGLVCQMFYLATRDCQSKILPVGLFLRRFSTMGTPWQCRKLPSYVPYKGTYVPYDGTFGAPDQGQTLDVWESQTTESPLRNDWPRIVPRNNLEVVLEVILEHMCTGLRPWHL